MPNQIRGLLLSTQRGNGGLTSFTGKPPPSLHYLLSIFRSHHFLGTISAHTAHSLQCEHWGVVCAGTVHLSNTLPEIR